MKKIIFFNILFFSWIASAATFRNAYVSFELPNSWKCNLEQTEWVCRSDQSKESKEAIIILTAKEVGPTDTFSLYQQHLDSQISMTMRTGGTAMSKVVYKSKNLKINDHPWLDGLHLGSEVGNYYTRYLATIKENIAILVTLSAHKNTYTKYTGDFNKAVQSLRVIASKNLLSQPNLAGIRPSTAELNAPVSNIAQNYLPADDAFADPEATAKAAAAKKKKQMMIAGALIIAAVGAYLVIKNKNG